MKKGQGGWGQHEVDQKETHIIDGYEMQRFGRDGTEIGGRVDNQVVPLPQTKHKPSPNPNTAQGMLATETKDTHTNTHAGNSSILHLHRLVRNLLHQSEFVGLHLSSPITFLTLKCKLQGGGLLTSV